MPEDVKSEARSQFTVGSDATSGARIGSEARWMQALGSDTAARVLTPGAVVVAAAFTTWGQTDILFGGVAMDTPYSGLG